MLWGGHHRRIMEKVCAYMGANPDVSGGTMGEPNTDIPAYVYKLEEDLLDSFWGTADVASPVDLGKPGPWNQKEIRRRALVRYLFLMCEYHN